MTRVSSLSLTLLIAATLTLAGCGQSSTPEEPSAASSAAQAHNAPAAATAVTSPGNHVSTKHYRIDISYPRLPASDAALIKALHQTGAKAKQQFLKALPDPKKYPEMANRQFLLKLDFSVAAQMPAFVSVREKGMADTGGAHPIPMDGTFVYATRTDKIITLDDLFTDPVQARQRLAKVARESLEKTLLAKVPGGARTTEKARKEWIDNMRQMIHDGTEPTPQNYAEFVVLAGVGDQASGLELIFSPYQVAPYVYGSQSVQVPVDVFADLLKPTWRDDFDTGN